MQRSEEIYYQQTTLLNSMVPIFGAMEKVLEACRNDGVARPLERLSALRADFLSRQQACLRREEDALYRVRGDRERLNFHQRKLLAVRAGQEKGLENYFEEWETLYNTSVSEQLGCLRMMEQLERRMRELGKEQQFLVQDRLLRLKEEYQRREDAAAFECFAAEHGAVLTAAEGALSKLVENIKIYTTEIQRGYEHLESYIANDVAKEIDVELLNVHKSRLEQFRELYTTLGDLQFKKARHLEEVEKKISNYEMYQEVAMDTLNPKAKVYSQARKSWKSVHNEVQQQLEVLNRQCEAEISSFKRTEQALLMAGVNFISPVEEVTMRNQKRQQKLLEYRQLMESEMEKQTISENEKAQNSISISTTTKNSSKGHELRINDPKKARENISSPKSDSSLGTSSPKSRRLPFLFSLKGKSSKSKKEVELLETPRPPSHQSESMGTPCGESSILSQHPYSMENKTECRSPISNGKK
ncbi:unnamed protein product [Phytomonas sp. Hart1]|nr:unnamed protein product [Phytomonas sp. Hart1]|eukprot:CCW69095.1 unnamed protein product [Phytomonas sp. isolate Hart1]